MQVKVFDYEHELDLEKAVNDFIKDKKVIDIKYQTSHFYDYKNQLYCFSAMVLYELVNN